MARLIATAAASGPPPAESADQLFQGGRFAEADLAYAEILSADPTSSHALTQRAHIDLLSNRLSQARTLLEQSLQLDPRNPRAGQLLALAYYRADEFAAAAALGYQAPLLSRFEERVPYEIAGPATSRVRLLQSSPLLLVDVSVNGLAPAPFVLDTGTSTLMLLPSLADRAAAPLFSFPGGLVAIGTGGQQLDLGQMALIDSVSIGDFEVRNIPGGTGSSIARGVRAPDGRPVEGAIGSTFLSHFIATLDYPGDALVLRRKTPALLAQIEADAAAASAATIPFWIYGDHFILTRGSVNGYGPFLFVVDTGANTDYASMALLPTDATIEQARISVDQSRPQSFVGSGGESSVYPMQVDELALGSVVGRNVNGAAGVWRSLQFPGAVEPTIGGAVSSAFFSALALTIDTEGMRLFLSAG